MHKKSESGVYKIVDWLIVFTLGIFCFCYAVFYSDFAEVNIQLPFLDFPIFVGEILLGISIVLLFIKWKVDSIYFNRWYYLLLLPYIAFVLFKAFYGYSKWGPLAFRNAALFYYFLFAVIYYHLFNRSVLKKRAVYLLLLFILSGLILIYHVKQDWQDWTPNSFLYTYLILVLVLFLSINNKALRYVAILVFFVIFPYKSFVILARTFLVSEICALLLLIAGLFLIIKIKFIYKMLLSLSLLIIFGVLVNSLTDKADIKSLVSPGLILERYRNCMDIVEAKKGSFKRRDDIPTKVKLYVPNFLFHALQPRKALDELDRITEQQKSAKAAAKEAEAVVKKAEAVAKKAEAVAKKAEAVAKKAEAVAKKAEAAAKKTEAVAKKAEAAELAEIAASKRIEADKLADEIAKRAVRIKTMEELAVKRAAMVQKMYDDETRQQLAEEAQQRKEDGPTIKKEKKSIFFNFNTTWRLLVWRDIFTELFESRKNIFGVDFGKPFRSKSAEILGMECGLGLGWSGWLEPHNSYIHILYRAGIMGVLFIIAIWSLFIKMVMSFIKGRNVKGILLSSALFYWLIAANFAVILELPYFAIPFWSLFGITLAYCSKGIDKNKGQIEC